MQRSFALDWSALLFEVTGAFLYWIRKTVQHAVLSPDRSMEIDNLQRLAETSPHLLDDIGMLRVPRVQCSGMLWVRGRYRVEVPRTGADPVARRIG